MKGAFCLDSKLYRAVDKAVGMVKLNLLFVLFSLPVITIGASCCALHDTAMKIAENEEGYIFRNFVKVFRNKWRQSLKIWSVLLIVFAGLCMNFLFWTRQQGIIPEIMIGVVLMMLALWFFLTVYASALMTRTEAAVGITLKTAAFLAIKYLPKSCYMLLWTVLFLAAGWLWTPVMLAELLSGAALLAVIHGKVLVSVFEAERIN